VYKNWVGKRTAADPEKLEAFSNGDPPFRRVYDEKDGAGSAATKAASEGQQRPASRGTDRRRADGVEPGAGEAVGEDDLEPRVVLADPGLGVRQVAPVPEPHPRRRRRRGPSRRRHGTANPPVQRARDEGAHRGPRCRCLCIFPAQPSTGALASSSIAARRGRGSRVLVRLLRGGGGTAAVQSTPALPG